MASPVAMEIPMVMEGRVVVRRRAKDARSCASGHKQTWKNEIDHARFPRCRSGQRRQSRRARAPPRWGSRLCFWTSTTRCARRASTMSSRSRPRPPPPRRRSPSAGPSPPVPSIARACSRTSGRCSRARRGTRPRTRWRWAPGAARCGRARSRCRSPPRRRARRRGGRRRRRRRADRVRRPQAGAPPCSAAGRARGGWRTRAQSGSALVVITNGHHRVQRDKLAAVRAHELFPDPSAIIVGEEVLRGGTGEARRANLPQGVSRRSRAPNEAAHVGDSLATDVQVISAT